MIDIQLQIILKLIIAGVLGGLLGFERESVHKPAGLRTYIFVTLTAALITTLALEGIPAIQNGFLIEADVLRLIAGLFTGIGFIGAGVIIHRSDHHIEGITTAAGLWITTAIGITVGMGLHLVAASTTIISLFVFFVLGRLEGEDIH